MAIAFVFPGQGSQAVGMAADLAKGHAAAREVLAEVDSALGQKLSELMFSGPIEELTLTENAQPALMAASLAVMRVLEAEKGFRLADRVKYVAGHSLGEYSALAAAGALSAAALGHVVAAAVALALWAAFTMRFLLRRLRDTAKSAPHLAEMAITSLAIPFVAVFWRIYGAIRYRSVFW